MHNDIKQHRWQRAKQAAQLFNEMVRRYNTTTDYPVGNKAKKIVKAHRIYMTALSMCPTTCY